MNLSKFAINRNDLISRWIEAYNAKELTHDEIEEMAGFLKDRNPKLYHVIKMRGDKKTLKAIGDHYGVTVERARQIVFKAQKAVEKEYIKNWAKVDFLNGVDVGLNDVFADNNRVLNNLHREGLRTISDLISFGVSNIGGAHSVGKKTVAEVKRTLDWLNSRE